jgi:adenosylcobinamide-GDP ribazoletransferase
VPFPALRLAVGTLTVIPVGDLPEIDSRTAGRAMLLAPLAVLPLAAATALVGWLASTVGLPALVIGLLMVAVLALGTRALHLDGLADTADGLGSGWNVERSLEIMKRGNIGPMGVVTLIVTLGLQAAALSALVDGFAGAVTAGILVCASRVALVTVCAQGVPPARTDGLGAVVAGTVGRAFARLSWVLTGVVLIAVFGGLDGRWWLGLIATALAGLGVLALVRHCVRRFGGVTGDVMGAAIETAFTVLVLCAAVR